MLLLCSMKYLPSHTQSSIGLRERPQLATFLMEEKFVFWVHFLSLILSLAIDSFFLFFFGVRESVVACLTVFRSTFLSFITLHTRDGEKEISRRQKRNFLRVSEDAGSLSLFSAGEQDIIITANKRRFFAAVSPGNKDF